MRGTASREIQFRTILQICYVVNLMFIVNCQMVTSHAESTLGALPMWVGHDNRNVRVAMATAALDFCIFYHSSKDNVGDGKLQCVSLIAEILAKEQDVEVCLRGEWPHYSCILSQVGYGATV